MSPVRTTRTNHGTGGGWWAAAGPGLFVCDFDAVVTAYGPVTGMIGSRPVRWQDPLMRRRGVVVIIIGCVLLGKFSWLQHTRRLAVILRSGLGGAPRR